MTVIELINKLNDMPHSGQVYIDLEAHGTRRPQPEMEYNDLAENYVVVL